MQHMSYGIKDKMGYCEKKSPEKQPRFAQTLNCKYRDLFDIYNDWTILHIVATKKNDNDDLHDVNMDVLDSILCCITSEIKVNRIGAYMKNSKCDDDYNIVR